VCVCVCVCVCVISTYSTDLGVKQCVQTREEEETYPSIKCCDLAQCHPPSMLEIVLVEEGQVAACAVCVCVCVCVSE
jgi:hypothetical protein